MPFAPVVKGMLVELTSEVKDYLRHSAAALRGFDRRLFMARTVRLLGHGGQSRAERELGWSRVTVRKGVHEFDSGIRCADAFSSRGRKRAEEHLPGLRADIRSLVDGQSQTDPTFHSQRLYTRLSAAEVRRQLVLQKGHAEADLPSAETIRREIHAAGYSPRKVAKCRPKKSCPRPTPSSAG
jgi:Rhodopirellula transposase DDE domain